jgi:hypothetical protein
MFYSKGGDMIVRRLDYANGGDGPEAIEVPDLPGYACSVDMLPDGIYATGWEDRSMKGGWKVWQLCFGSWLPVKCPALIEHLEYRDSADEIEYTRN